MFCSNVLCFFRALADSHSPCVAFICRKLQLLTGANAASGGRCCIFRQGVLPNSISMQQSNLPKIRSQSGKKNNKEYYIYRVAGKKNNKDCIYRVAGKKNNKDCIYRVAGKKKKKGFTLSQSFAFLLFCKITERKRLLPNMQMEG